MRRLFGELFALFRGQHGGHLDVGTSAQQGHGRGRTANFLGQRAGFGVIQFARLRHLAQRRLRLVHAAHLFVQFGRLFVHDREYLVALGVGQVQSMQLHRAVHHLSVGRAAVSRPAGCSERAYQYGPDKQAGAG
jgi:hypothetical protein